MFSSKKFSDIMKKHKKFTRYHDTEESEESCIDLQSNRHSKQGLHVVDIIDNEKDILNRRTYQTPGNHGQINYDNELIPSTFDKIRKVEIKSPSKGSSKSGNLKFSDLSNSPKNSLKISSKKSAASKIGNERIFTTSINLISQSPLPSNSSSDRLDISLTQPPCWNFGQLTSGDKNIIFDDFEEFKYDEELEPNDPRRIKEELDWGDGDRNWGIEEQMDDGEGRYENVSVFEDEGEGIEFDMEGEGEKEKDTLKQMRMLFGSEQKIREQSEAAIMGEEVEESCRDEFRTPGLSQSIVEGQIEGGKGWMFDKKSFQEFSMKKFKEMMFENNFSEFMSSVERTVRENTKDNLTSRTIVEGSPKREKSITSKRNTNFVSPRKWSRKELELDRIVGSKMKFMSEKKRQRRSMLDNTDSSFVKEITQDPLNKSMDISRAKNWNANNSNKNLSRTLKPKIATEINLPLNSGIIMQSKNTLLNLDQKVNKIIDRTDQIFIKDKLCITTANRENEDAEEQSIRRSNVRGLDQLLSEKSQEIQDINNKSLVSKHEEMDDNKTLKYDTVERVDRSGSDKSRQSQKEAMYDHLEKIMTNWFKEEQKDSKVDVQDYQTLKYGDTEENNESSHREGVSPLSSESSSPTTAKRIVSNNDTRKEVIDKIEDKIVVEKLQNLVTPRDSQSESEHYSYRTPTTAQYAKNSQKDYANAILQPPLEFYRREDAFSSQFYNSNKNYRPNMNRSGPQEENIRIWVDQWDGEISEKKFGDTSSSDPYCTNESIAIHTAKNSPFESYSKEKEYNSSDKYSMTEESAEKHLSEQKYETMAFDYTVKAGLANVKRNLQHTLQDHFNGIASPGNKHFILNANKSQEVNSNMLDSRIKYEDFHLIPEYPNMVSPVDLTSPSPSTYEENKCIVLSNKKWKSIDSDSAVAIYDDPDQMYGLQDNDKKAEWVTEEILSMMLFSDIHDHPLFPYRTNQVIKDAKDKFPFNKPLGINTGDEGVEDFLDTLIAHIEEYFLQEVIENLEAPIKVDPLIELAQLQFYEENSISRGSGTFEEILPNEIFYSIEQIRKHIYDNTKEEKMITEDEKFKKIHNTFIHDKMLFDSFNTALNLLSHRHEDPCPWTSATNNISKKVYNHCDAMVLLTRTKDLVLSWNRISAGTNKIPPLDLPPPSQNSSEDIFAPPPPVTTDEERNQQIREEKLSLLLSKNFGWFV
jgi:hypothetical protein